MKIKSQRFILVYQIAVLHDKQSGIKDKAVIIYKEVFCCQNTVKCKFEILYLLSAESQQTHKWLVGKYHYFCRSKKSD